MLHERLLIMNRLLDIPGRIEKKYAVSEQLAERVLHWSAAFLKRDRGLDEQRVTTLYLDTPSLTFYHAHLDREADRFKLRIRGYGEPPGDTVYAEIKRKAGDLVRKDRAELSFAMLSAILDDQHLEAACSGAVHDFVKTLCSFNAGPTVLVSGLRNALRDNTADGELAVTADRQLVCQPTSRYSLAGDPTAWRPLMVPDHASAIVELKYINQPPDWMATLMSELAPHRVRFSKYGAAMQQECQEAVV